MFKFRFTVLAAVLFAGATAAGSADVQRTYMVRLAGVPLIEHLREQGGGSLKAQMRRAQQSSDAAAYLQQLDAARESVLAAARAELAHDVQPRHIYRHAANGMSLRLTEAEAAALAKLPGVQSVRPERHEHLLTDAGPQWIGADALWNGQEPGGLKSKGEGVVIGIVDTGISPSHPSFAATGPDGFAISNARGHFYGLCTTGQATCNNKLIGIYDFTDEGTKGVDSVGHGTHVSSIAAGDAITDALQGYTVALPRAVSGVAPHANIIMYKACVNKDAANPDGGCAESALLGALDQAVADGVDVINFSIGGDADVDPYELLDEGNNDASAMFQARAAGIVVVAAAGNEGPGPHSIDEPGNAPWVLAVANATHNRRFATAIGNFSGVSGAPSGTLTGAGYTAGYGPAAIVYAGDFGNALCGVGDSEGVNPTGASNPFAAGTFHGEIVVCDRGTYARVEKGYNVLHAGAGGYVLANTAADGESTVSDDHFLPAVHLGFNEGAQLKSWLALGGTHSGTISGVTAALDPQYGDILESSSSRGPYGFSGGVLKPDITAPGTNILAADYSSSGLALMTGTSMASPHVAGAVALLVGAHPDWSPAQLESALLGTALAGSVRTQDLTPASPLDAGAGRAQPASAVRAGLYLPLDANALRAQDTLHGGDPSKLNRSGIESENCLSQCSFTRTVTDMSGGGTWQISVTATARAIVSVTPNQFTLNPGASQQLNINVDVSDPFLPGTWVDGSIVLHKSSGGQTAADTALTLAAYATAGIAQPFQEIVANAPGGSATLNAGGLVPLPIATFGVATLEVPQTTDMNLGVDPTPNDIYSTFPGDGKQFVLFPLLNGEVNASGLSQNRVLIAEITASNAPRAQLFAGIDSNGDGQPNFAEQTCSSAAVAGSVARCVVDLRDAPLGGNAWALVEIPQGSVGAHYSVTLSAGLPAFGPTDVLHNNFAGTVLDVDGPGHVPTGAGFPLRVSWNNRLPPNTPFPYAIGPGRFYGAVLIGDTRGFAGQTGFLPFALTRTPGGNDVADALEYSAYVLQPGESLRQVFVDVPAAGTLNVGTWCAVAATCAGNFSVYVARAEFPDFSAAPDIAAAPASSGATAQWTFGGTVQRHDAAIPVSAGRWYIVATETGSTAGIMAMGAQFVPSAPVTHPAQGAYFNPKRSGHGIFMNDAAGNRVLYWYTYLEDGTPVWYTAGNPVPDSNTGTWTAPLLRVNWMGTAINSFDIVGDVLLTPVDATEFIYSWHLYGVSGSERFTLLAPSTCLNLNGSQVDLTGQWFAPTQSGYGMDVLALDATQFDAFYLYDALGQPRWVAGSASPFGAVTTFALDQLSGFCPTCAWSATVPTQVGTLSAGFTSGTQGHYATQINLAPPLSGSFNIDQPTSRLTGSPTCP
jgi:subtilisin family serine protease